LCDRFDVDRKLIRIVLVDETMIKIRGKRAWAWVWVASEPGLRAFLAFRISYNQSTLVAYLFLKELRSRYGRRPIWTEACGTPRRAGGLD
jgi:transposase-like protein